MSPIGDFSRVKMLSCDRKQWSLGVRQRRKTFWTTYKMLSFETLDTMHVTWSTFPWNEKILGDFEGCKQPSKLSPSIGYDRIFTLNITFLPTFISFYGHYDIYFTILIHFQNCYIMANMKYYSSSSRNQYRLVFRRYTGWISAGALTVLTDALYSFLQLFQALPRCCLRLGHNFLLLHPFQLIIHASS